MRRLTCHKKVNFEGDELQVLICYEEGFKKEDIKKENPYSKTHEILVRYGNKFEFARQRA
jgi:hypothetical protein